MRKQLLLSVAASVFIYTCEAQQIMQLQAYPSVSLTNSQQHRLYSAQVHQNFDLYIALPNSYFARDTTYPVLYMTDANVHFGMMTDIARSLHGGKEMPEVTIVGITYPLAQRANWGKLRLRELTPTRNEQMDKRIGIDSIKSGGSPAFLRFIKDELIPFIETRYRVKPNNRTFAGYSVGGLFGLYMAFNQPQLFQQYIIGSPSIWYDSKFIVQQEKNFSDSHPDWDATVFMSVGSLEPGMVSDMVDLSTIIEGRKYNQLRFHSVVLDGETHASAVSGCFQQGLRFLFLPAK